MARRSKFRRYQDGGEFGTNDPGRSRGLGLGAFDIAQLAFDTGFPAIDLLFNKRNEKGLREKAQVDLQPVELDAGPIRGLRRGRFALPNRTPTGSTLEAQQAEKLFRDARVADAEFRFDAADEAFRLQQEQQARGIKNQEAMINNQIANQEELANANVAAQELLNLNIPNREASKTALFQNISGDIAEIGTNQANQRMALARDILYRQEDAGYNDADIEWARGIVEGVIRRRFGGKMKSKFSK